MRLKIAPAVAALCLLPSLAHAATSGSLTINGKVPIVCGVSVAAAPGATNISDLSAGNASLLVATVTENCNDPVGYAVTVVGTNSASYTGLFKDSVSGATQPFTVSYAGTAVSAATITNVVAPANVAKDVRITYAANSALTGSTGYTYAETLTFVIVAK